MFGNPDILKNFFTNTLVQFRRASSEEIARFPTEKRHATAGSIIETNASKTINQQQKSIQNLAAKSSLLSAIARTPALLATNDAGILANDAQVGG